MSRWSFFIQDDEEEPLESQTFKVDHIIIHPDFRYIITVLLIMVFKAITICFGRIRDNTTIFVLFFG
jgi:hypothetical protein